MLRQVADGRIRRTGFGRAPGTNGQHQLMLLRLEALGTSGIFAEVEKPSDLIPKLAKSLVIGEA